MQDKIDLVRGSRSRLALLRHCEVPGVRSNDTELATAWGTDRRTVIRARLALVEAGMLDAVRRSRWIEYRLTDEGRSVLEAVDKVVARERGTGFRSLVLGVMRYCMELKETVAAVADYFNEPVTPRLREACAYAIAWDGAETHDYSRAAEHLVRKAHSFREHGEQFGQITGEAWLCRMAKRWRWIPTEAEQTQIRKKRDANAAVRPVRSAPVSVQAPIAPELPVSEARVTRRSICELASVCGAKHYAVIRELILGEVGRGRVVVDQQRLHDTEAVRDALRAFRSEFVAAFPDTELRFHSYAGTGCETIGDWATKFAV